LCFSAPLFAQGPPPESGVVERWEGSGWFYWYADEKRGYVAFHGVDVIAGCADDPETEWSVWQVQDVFIPASDGLIKTNEVGDDSITSVWPIEILDEDVYPHWCFGVLDLDPIATGTADVLVVDNDLFGGWFENTPRMNAYSLSAHGVLESFDDGEPMRINGGFNCHWPGYPADYQETNKCKEKIVLH
jgi:hypothetical protein